MFETDIRKRNLQLVRCIIIKKILLLVSGDSAGKKYLVVEFLGYAVHVTTITYKTFTNKYT